MRASKGCSGSGDGKKDTDCESGGDPPGTRLADLELALEHMPQGLCMYDESGRLTVFNRRYAEAIGVAPEQIRVGMTTREVLEAMSAAGWAPGKSVDELEEEAREIAWSGNYRNLTFQRHDGHMLAMQQVQSEAGPWIAIYDDVTEQLEERRQADEALKESEERFRLAAEAAGFGVWDYDTLLKIREWSARLREIFGLGPDLTPTLETALALVHPEDRDLIEQTFHRIDSGQHSGRFEATIRIKRASEGALRHVTLNGWRTAKAGSPNGRIIMTVRDVTDEKLAEERIRWTATHDGLTGLANRAAFYGRLTEAMAVKGAGGKSAVGVLLLDLDRFKQINDNLGHDAGDWLLRTFAARLQAMMRKGDTLARLGGDEFAIILNGIDGEKAIARHAAAILESLREPFIYESRALDCHASIGAALFPAHGKTTSELLKHADMALYASKAAGRATFTMFNGAMKAAASQQSAMISAARSALEERRIFPHYQPKVELATGRVAGFEALLRWRTPEGDLRQRASLDAAFEDVEMANAISDRMVEKAIADMSDWLAQDIAFGHVALNASAIEFRRDDFAERILARLADAGIPASYLEVEVAETIFLGSGAQSVYRAVELLSREGVRIALDHFGTGHASLRHLKNLPVDTVKIDRSFVQGMEGDSGEEAIIRAIIDLGRSLAITVVAEGIEKRPQAEGLARLGCNFGQGHFFAKPVPAAFVPALVGRNRSLPGPMGSGALRSAAR